MALQGAVWLLDAVPLRGVELATSGQGNLFLGLADRVQLEILIDGSQSLSLKANAVSDAQSIGGWNPG